MIRVYVLVYPDGLDETPSIISMGFHAAVDDNDEPISRFLKSRQYRQELSNQVSLCHLPRKMSSIKYPLSLAPGYQMGFDQSFLSSKRSFDISIARHLTV